MVSQRVSAYLAKIELLDEKLRGEDSTNVNLYRNFLEYLQSNPDETYYPITKIFTAANCKYANQALDVANFFSLGNEPLLFVTFCYFDFDGTDIHLDRECFIDSLTSGVAPIADETGNPIENFDPSRLGFYCNLVSR